MNGLFTLSVLFAP